MKKVLAILSIFFVCSVCVNADEVVQHPAQNPLTVSQNIMFDRCTKIFKVNQEKLFYLTLASISANRFNVDEIQTSNGYVIFTANHNKYLAAIAKVDGANSILKITPCNNVYNFPPGILVNMFKYIDMNLSSDIKS